MSNSKSSWLFPVLVAVAVGSGIGFWAFKHYKKDAPTPTATQSQTETPVTGNQDRTPEAQENAELQQDQGPKVATDETFADNVVFMPIRNGQEMVTGARLTFSRSFLVPAKVYNGSELSGVTVSAGYEISGTWISDQEFEVRLAPNQAKPNSKIQIGVTKLPLADDATLTLENSGSPWNLTFPSFEIVDVQAIAVQPKSNAKLTVTTNYKVSTRDLLPLIKAKSGTTNFTDLTVKADTVRDSKTHYIRVYSKKITYGSMDLTIAGTLKVKDATVDVNQVQSVDLNAPQNLSISGVRVIEGSENFSIEINCYLDNYRHDRNHPCRIDGDSAKTYITVEPETSFNVVSSRGKFTLIGKFQAETQYKVDIAAGLKANGSAVLDKAFSRDVYVGSFKPSFKFQGKARYLPGVTDAKLSYDAINVPHIEVVVRQIFPQNILFWVTAYGEEAGSNVSEEVKRYTLDLGEEKNKRIQGQIDLASLNPMGKGIFAVTVNRLNAKKEYQSQLDQATVVVTNMAAVIKQDHNDLRVFIRSMDDLAPMSGVEVSLYSYANRKLGTCMTGGDEGCIVKGVMTGETKPHALILKKDDDLSYVPLSDLEIVDHRVHAGDRPFRQEGLHLESYIYTSRGVYRPGESARFGALTYSADRKPATATPVQWKFKNPRGKVFREASVKTSSQGMLSYELPIDSFAQTGKYEAELWSGDTMISSKGFLVEDFVPERIGIKVKPENAEYVDGSIPTFDIDAKYLFGPPVANGSYSVRCSLTPAYFTVPNQPAYATGRYSQAKFNPVSLETVTGTLDENGLAKAGCDYSSKVTDTFPTVMSLNATADVQEAGSGRVTSKFGSVLVSATPHIMGLRKMDVSNGKIRTEGKLFDLKGNDANAGGTVQLALYRVQWDWVYAYDPDYGYNRWHMEEYLLPDGATKEVQMVDGKFEAELSASRNYGGYVVKAKMPDQGIESDLKVSVGYYWYWSRSDDASTPAPRAADQLQLHVDKSELKPGEEFKVEFESPFAGMALVSMETDEIKSVKWVDVSKGPQSLTLEAPDVLPNFYVSLLVLKYPKDGSMFIPARAYGGKSIKVTPSDFRMNVEVKAPEEMRPNNELTIELASDTGEPTEYTVAVVDEGILQLTNFKTPDPEDFFFEQRKLGTRTFDTLGWTFSKSTSDGGDSPGGDSGDQGRVMPVRLVAYWSGLVTADDGKATVKFDIPPFQGKVRVMVVASSDGKMAHSESWTTIRDPLVLQPTFPRFLSDGDLIKVPVFVVNMTGEDQNVEVELTANSSMFVEDTKQTVPIKQMSSKTVFFDATVSDFTGTAVFNVVAKAGEFVTEDTATIPILPLTPEKTVMIAKKADQPYSLEQLVPDDVRAKPLLVEASVSTLPHLQSMDRMRYLIRYPYGCIEQTSSATYPLVYMPDLLRFAAPDLADQFDIKDMVYSGINRLLSMQTTSGGFAYWPGSNYPVLWGSTYVTNLLLDAKKAGYIVPESSLQEALGYLETTLKSGYGGGYDEYDNGNQTVHAESEPFILYVLGKGGKSQTKRLKEIAVNPPDWGELNEENRFLIMASLKLANEEKMMAQFAAKQDMYKKVSATGRRHSGSFWSAIRSDGMRLAIGEDLFPGDDKLELLANRVASHLAGSSYLSTQEVAWSVVGLGKRLQRFKNSELKNLKLTANGKTIKPNFVDGEIPTWKLYNMDVPNTKIAFTYESESTPNMYLRLRGYTKNYTVKAPGTVPFNLERKYFSLDGKPKSLSNLKQGELIVVELTMTNSQYDRLENLAIVDRLPAGFEIENPRLGRSTELSWLPEETFNPDYIDMRDDRIQIFGNFDGHYNSARKHKFYYVVRAVTAGRFNAPPAKMEMMYDPEKFLLTKYEAVTINVP